MERLDLWLEYSHNSGMGKTVGTLEARNNLSALIERAAAGEVITITRHGVPVVQLVPAEPFDRRQVAKAVHDLKTLRKGNRLGKGLAIRDLINEGRR